MNKRAEETFRELEDILLKLTTVDEFLRKGKILKTPRKAKESQNLDLPKRNKITEENRRNRVGKKIVTSSRRSNNQSNRHSNANTGNKANSKRFHKTQVIEAKHRLVLIPTKKKGEKDNKVLGRRNKEFSGIRGDETQNVGVRPISITHYNSEFGFVPPCFDFSSSEIESKLPGSNITLNTTKVNCNISDRCNKSPSPRPTSPKVTVSLTEEKKLFETTILKNSDKSFGEASYNDKVDCLHNIKSGKTALDGNDRQNVPEAKSGQDKAAFSLTKNKETKKENCAKVSAEAEAEKRSLSCSTNTNVDEPVTKAREINENGGKQLNCNSNVSLPSSGTEENNNLLSVTSSDVTKSTNTREERQIDEITNGKNSLGRTAVLIERLDSCLDQNSEVMDAVPENRTSESCQSSFRKSNEIVDNNFNSVSASLNTKRRESTSPDEGIVYSPVEIADDSPTFPKGKKLPEVEEKNEDSAHIQIMIEGGKASKSKKRSSKHAKSGRQRTPQTVDNKTAGSEKGNEVVIKSELSNVSHDAGTRSTKKKYRSHKSGKLSDRAVARNVVKNALIENTLAKKTKPVWVEITKDKSTPKMNSSYKIKDIERSSKQKIKQTKKHHKNATEGSKQTEDNRRQRLSNIAELKLVKNGGVLETPEKEYKNEGRWKQINHSSKHKYGSTSQTNASKSRQHINDHMKKLDLHRVENPRILRHRDRRESNRDSSDKNPRIFKKSGEKFQKTKYRSASVDSSVRDLSYSSSSSISQASSSSDSCTTSGTSGTHSATSSVSSSYSSSSALSTSYSSSSSTPRTVHEKTDYKMRMRRDREIMRKSDEKQMHTTHSTEHNEKSGYYGKSKTRVEKSKTSQRLASFQNTREPHCRPVDSKHIRKNAADDDQEFEVNLERRRKRTNKRLIESDEKKDPQKHNWQHQRLVMTSQRPGAPGGRTPEKIRQSLETFQPATKQKSFEASAKDSTGAVLTIRDLYSLHHVLSDTQNGTVIAGHRRSDGMRVAIKRIAKSGTTRWGWMNGKVVPLELALICQVNEIRHPGVVEIVEWHETTEAFLLVMIRPHPSIDLYDHVTKQKRLKESVARRIVRQLILALLHCHKMGVLHRDVKLENILYNPATVDAILIDFGCGDYHRSGTYKEFAGTPEYYPPEWFLYKQYQGDSATVWSVGVLLYSLLCGTLPFRSSKDIINKELTKYPSEISWSAKYLITQALQKNPRERIELKYLLDHPWFKPSKEQSEHRKASV